MLDSKHLNAFLEREGIQAELITLPVHTLTVEAAAHAVGAEPARIVKSLLFLVKDEPVIAVVCGTDPVDRRALAAHFGVGRKRVKLAGAESVLEITGYPVGAMPPFGHLRVLETFIDPEVLRWETIYAGGGEVDALLRVAPTEIVRVTGATELRMRAPEGSDQS